MARQSAEQLFRQLKGQMITLKTISGGIYEGVVAEVAGDYICLLEKQNTEPTEVCVFYQSIESVIVVEVPTS
jgi:hypothetical protein